MDRADYVQRRKAKYMAQALDALEDLMVAGLGAEHAPAVRAFREARNHPVSPDRFAFRTHIEPLLPAAALVRINDFKALMRARFNALATDAVEIMSLDGHINGVAMDMRDALSPVGRP